MTSIRLLATDLDGTLLRSDRSISARTSQAMHRAHEIGIEIVWATARARHSVQDMAQVCGFRGKVIGANGAVVLDLADGTAVVTNISPLAQVTVDSSIQRVRDLVPGVTFATVGPTRFSAEPQYAELCVFADHHRNPLQMETSATALHGEPIVKIVARHPGVASIDLYRAVLAAGVDGVEVTHSGAAYIEMSAAGVSKASALAQLCADSGIDASEVAAVGDAFNDLPMLKWAGTALCPSNAIAEVASVADQVLGSNDEDGVAHYLEELMRSRI